MLRLIVIMIVIMIEKEEGDAQYRATSFLCLDLLTGYNANGVKLQSPVSRSARWVGMDNK